MNWKNEAIEDLRKYESKKHAASSIPEELAMLKSAMCGIRSATADGTASKGGGSGREDMLLSTIVKSEELKRSLVEIRRWIKLMDSALNILLPEERRILERFFINPESGAAERLAMELNVDIKTVYKRKDAALRKFTLARYGNTEI